MSNSVRLYCEHTGKVLYRYPLDSYMPEQETRGASGTQDQGGQNFNTCQQERNLHREESNYGPVYDCVSIPRYSESLGERSRAVSIHPYFFDDTHTCKMFDYPCHQHRIRLRSQVCGIFWDCSILNKLLEDAEINSNSDGGVPSRLLQCISILTLQGTLASPEFLLAPKSSKSLPPLVFAEQQLKHEHWPLCSPGCLRRWELFLWRQCRPTVTLHCQLVRGRLQCGLPWLILCYFEISGSAG